MSVTQSPALDQLAAALVKAQQQMERAVRSADNPFYKSKYADLTAVWDACRDALTQNGLCVIQSPGFAEGTPNIATVSTMLLHVSGQWVCGTAGAPLTKLDAQGVGSAISYLRRYALAAVAGVVQEDDDGEGAVTRTAKSVAKPKGPPTAKELTEKPAALTPEPDPLNPQEKILKRKGHPATALRHVGSTELLAVRAKIKTEGTPEQQREWIDAIDTVLASREGL